MKRMAKEMKSCIETSQAEVEETSGVLKGRKEKKEAAAMIERA